MASDHGPNRVEDPLRTLRGPEPGTPVGQDRVVKPGVVQGQTRCHLPADAVAQGPGGVAVGQALEGLEHHHGGDHVRRNRRSPPTRGEQVGEQLIGEQLLAVIGEERLDAALWDELAAEGRRIKQLTIGIAVSLHAQSLAARAPDREHPEAISSAVS